MRIAFLFYYSRVSGMPERMKFRVPGHIGG